MATAAEKNTPHLDGWHFGDSLKQGTGGHGDTAEVYGETYSRVISTVSKVEKLNTGKKDSKGRIIYHERRYKVLRADFLSDVSLLSPLIVREFNSIGFNGDDRVECYDLMKWQKNKDGDGVEVKKGISIKIGNFEARLINKKHAFLFKGKIVRSLKHAKKHMNFL